MRATGLFLILCLLGITVSGCTKANSTFTATGAKPKTGNAEAPVEEAINADIAKPKGEFSKKSETFKTRDLDLTSGPDVDSGETSGKPSISPSKKGADLSSDGKASVPGATAGGMVGAGPPPGEPVLKPTAPATPPAVADPVVGREMPATKKAKPNQLQSGILTAGSFDDNVDPLVFSKFVKKMSQNRGLGDLVAKLQGQRLMVSVRDAAGKPVGGARVKLSGGASPSTELLTHSDGRAVFMLSLDQLPTDQGLLATVAGPNGGGTVTETIAVGSARWEITLPGAQSQLPKSLDLAIILDTTGSMQDEIDHLRAEIRGISAAIAEKFPEVKQRFALICYRDDGDDYVVRPFEFTDSLALFHKNLSAQSAAGGGDYPEAMHRGIEEANQLRWKEDRDTARVAFLIADAPPHAQHMNRTLAAVNNLRKKGVAMYPVACSGYDDACELVMRSSALLTGGQFLFLTDDSGVGNAHAEPKIPYYQVERLEKLMVRMIASELSGQRISPNPADIIRTVGKKVN